MRKRRYIIKALGMCMLTLSVSTSCLSLGNNMMLPGSAISIYAAQNITGTCGKNAKWVYDNGNLTISGTGAMNNISDSKVAPWAGLSESITSVTIEEGITTIGAKSFYGLTKLKKVVLPGTLTGVGRLAFVNCSSLESITLPAKVKKIGYAAFANCVSLDSISASGAQVIEDYAFQNTSAKSFKLGKSVKDISVTAFYGAELTYFTVDSGNTKFSATSGVLYSDGGRTLYRYPEKKTNKKFVIPDGVVTIGESAFLRAKNLEKILIADSVAEAGMFAFYECESLYSVEFGSGLESTSYQMFANCDKLSVINFGTGLKKIGSQSFAYCDGITEIALPKNVAEVSVGSFSNCSNLTTFSSTGLTSVPYTAFMGCETLSTVKLNKGVKKIARAAFYGCNKLESVTLPSTVTYVHSEAFSKNTKITCQNKSLSKYGVNGYRSIQVVSITGKKDYDKAYEMLDKINAERAKAGLSKLMMDEKLLTDAMNRASELTVMYAHTRPDGSNYKSIDQGITAENILIGKDTAASALKEIEKDKSNKANITAGYTTVGIGCFYHNGTYYWVQEFGNGKIKDSYAKPKNKSTTVKLKLAVGSFEEEATGIGTQIGLAKEYKYTFRLKLKSGRSAVKKAKTDQIVVEVINPLYEGAGAKVNLNSTNVTYESSDKKVMSVDKNGVVTAKKDGSVVLKAVFKKFSAKKKVKAVTK